MFASTRSDSTDALHIAAIIGVVLLGATAVFVAGVSTSLRNFAIIGAGAMVVAGGLLSGNPRLYTLWGLMLTTPLNLSKRFGPMFLGKPGGEDSFRIEISDLFLVALVAFIVWDLLTGRRKGIRVPRLTFAWVTLIAIGIVWIIVGPWRTTAAHEVVRMLKVITLFLVICNEVQTPRRLWHCCAAMAVGAFGESAIGLIQYQIRGLIGLEILGETNQNTIRVLEATSVQGTAVFRPSALLQHANLMGMYLACMLPVAIAMLITAKGTWSRLFFLTTVGLSSLGVVISLSRSAWLSAAVAVVVVLGLMPLHPRLRWRSLQAGSMVAVVGTVVMISLSGPIIQRAFNSKNDSSVAREIYKADARKMIADAPLVGHGLNGYIFELPSYTNISMRTYGGNLPSVHHIIYLWWAETGLFGMLLFLTVWGSMIWAGIMNLTVRDEMLFAINAACLAALICLIPDSFFSFTLRVNTLLRVFWLLGGIILAIRYMRLAEPRRSSPRLAEPLPVTAPPRVTAPALEALPSG